MKLLKRLFLIARDPKTVAMAASYGLIVKLLIAPEAPVVTLAGLLLSLLAQLGHHTLRHRERIHTLHAATADHLHAQKELQGKVEELGNAVKSLTNAMGSGNSWSSK